VFDGFTPLNSLGGVGLMRSWNAMQNKFGGKLQIVSSGKMQKENSPFCLVLGLVYKHCSLALIYA